MATAVEHGQEHRSSPAHAKEEGPHLDTPELHKIACDDYKRMKKALHRDGRRRMLPQHWPPLELWWSFFHRNQGKKTATVGIGSAGATDDRRI